MEQPDVLLLDEPTNAIDKKGVELVHQIMSEEASRGAIVLLASHVDYDIRSLCSKVFLIEKGKMHWRCENGRLEKVVYMDCCSFSLDGSCRKSDYGAGHRMWGSQV